MGKRMTLAALVLMLASPPVTSADVGTTHSEIANAIVAVDVPLNTGPLHVQVDASSVLQVRNGETLIDTTSGGFFALQYDPQTGEELVYAACLFDPAEITLEPNRTARLVGGGSCENGHGGEPLTFSVDLSWRHAQLGSPGGHGYVARDALVNGSIIVEGVAVNLVDAAGVFFRGTQRDPLAVGVFEGGGGFGGSNEDMSGCLDGGYVIDTSYDAIAHYATPGSGDYHVNARFTVTLITNSVDGVVNTYRGATTHTVSYVLPPLDEFGQRWHFIDVPIALAGSEGSHLDAVLRVGLYTVDREVQPLLFAVGCA